MPSPLLADGNSTAPVYSGDVSTPAGFTPDPKYTDSATLSIVCQDFDAASNHLNNKMWVLHWRESDTLYQSPRTQAVFEGSTVARANVSRFNVAKAVNSIAPALNGAIFSEPTPFEIRPRPNVHQDTARAWKELIAILLDMCDFKLELSYGNEGMVNQGTAVYKMGWEEYTEMETRWERKAAPQKIDMPLGGPPILIFTKESDEFEKVTKEVTRKRPTFEKVELGSLFPNPKWNKPNMMWKAGWVVQEYYLNYDDLKKLRQNPDYDIPDDETLRFIFTSDYESTVGSNVVSDTMQNNFAVYHAEQEDKDVSEDPLLKPMQVLEWWSEDTVRTVLQRKVVIRNGDNEGGVIPYVSANFWNIDNAGFGLGVGRIAGSDQRVDAASTNGALDLIAFAVQPEYAISRGANVPTQEQRRRIGGIRLVDGDATKAISLIPQPQVPADLWRMLQTSNMAADSATGADQAAVQGSLPGRGSSVGRSGTGAGMLQAAAQGRLQAPVERVIDGVLIPFIKFLWNQVKQRMTAAEVRAILGDHYAEALSIDFHDFYNADLKFDTVAGTRLAARARMAQSLPFLLQIFDNQAIVEQLGQVGWKVNVLELANMICDVNEWKNQRDLIVPLTDAEKQAMQQNNPAAAKMQADQAELQAKHQNDMELEDMKIKGRIAAESAKTAGHTLIQSPLDRAQNFAERTQDERTMQQSPYFLGAGQ